MVTVYNKGEGLYGIVKIELQQSLSRLVYQLESFKAEGPEASEAPGMKWLEEFVKACTWFEDKIVRFRLVRLIRCRF